MNLDSFLKDHSLFSRREFLRLSGKGCGAMGMTAAANTLLHQKLLASVAGDSISSGGDYKALVCVFLYGGNDGMNCFLPNTNFAEYSAARNEVALTRSELQDSETMPEYSFHPSLPFFRDAFDEGNLAVVGNVGTLVEPVSASDIVNATKPVPPQLFSHNNQQTQWQTSLPDQESTSGWGGRLGDAAEFFNTQGRVSISASLGRDNIFSVGNRTTRLELNGGAVSLTRRGQGGETLQAAADIRDLKQGHVFRKEFANIVDRGVEAEILLSNVINNTPDPTAPGGKLHAENANEILFQQLRSATQLINAREQLGVQRQIFFVNLNNFDTHGSQLTSHAERLLLLDKAMELFCEEMADLGLSDNVTTFTTTEFGRTYSSNANGTDHGWGNNHFVIGGSVDGGKIHNSLPSFQFGAPDDSGFGRWIPSASTDEYAATLAKWFGVRDSDIANIVPNIGRFNTTAADNFLGFMKSS